MKKKKNVTYSRFYDPLISLSSKQQRNVHTCWIFASNSTLTVLFSVKKKKKKKKKNRDNDNEMKFK